MCRQPRRLSATLLASSGDAALVGAGSGLEFTVDRRVVAAVHGLVGRNGSGLSRAGARGTDQGGGLEPGNVVAVVEQRAACAPTRSTRRREAAIYRSFGDWLRSELGRAPMIGDRDGDVTSVSSF